MLRRLAVLVSTLSLLVVGAVGGVFADRLWLAHRAAGADGDAPSLHETLIDALHGSGARLVSSEERAAASGEDGSGSGEVGDGGTSANLLLRLHDELIGRLRDAVDLDAGQLAAVDSLIRERQHGVDDTWHQLHHRLQAAMDTVHHEIMGILRPEQREAFRRWVEDPHGGAQSGAPPGPGG